jgi:hypothetical protein
MPAGYRLVFRVVCFLAFWCRVFLPLAIFGSKRRTRSMSDSLHECIRIRPIWTILGAGIFFSLMYLLKAIAVRPNFLAASRVE